MKEPGSSTYTASDKRKHGFFVLDNALIDILHLDPHEGWLYAVIVRYVNHKTNVAFPSLATLAQKSGMSRRSVIRYIDRLEERGLIRRTQRLREGKKEFTSNHYEIVNLWTSDATGAAPDLADSTQVGSLDKRSHPFFIIDNPVVDDYQFNPYEGWLYATIVRFVNHRTGFAFPTQKELAESSGMSVTSVKKYLKTLEDRQLIRCIQQFSEWGDPEANLYEIVNLPGRENTPEPENVEEEVEGRPPQTPPQSPDALGDSRDSHHLGQQSHHGQPPVSPPETLESPQVGRDSHHLGREWHPNKKYLKRDDPEPDDIAIQSEEDRSKREREDLRPDAQSEHRATAAATGTPPSPVQISPQSGENDWNAFCELLANICKLDYALAKGKVQATARKLWQKGQGYSVADLRLFEVYWVKEDWRGKKGDVPSLNEVLLTIRKAVESAQTKENDPQRLIRGYEDIIES